MADTSLAEKKIGMLIWLASNFWQSKLRLILKKHNFSLNEYLILESISSLVIKNELISQVNISSYAGIDVSVVSTSLKSLEKKLMVKKIIDKDNRIKIIKMLPEGSKIFNILYPLIISEEEKIFSKLQDEKNNFTNSLRLILGRKIRIRLNNKI
tara:strand:- start:112 stop:573 length:462 start_codon:yes stop_codon:yes gene_type:complete